MKKRSLYSGAVLIMAAGLIFGVAPGYVEKQMNVHLPHAPFEISDQAQALHETLIVGDLHADSFLWDRDLSKRANVGSVDFPRLKEGNFAIQVFAAVTKSPRGQNYEENDGDSDNITPIMVSQLRPIETWSSLFARGQLHAQLVNDYAREHPEDMILLRNQNDLATLMQRRAKGDDVVGGLIAMEGAHPLEGGAENVKAFATMGYRMMGLTHFFDNELGGSLHGKSQMGLTEFGKTAIKRMMQNDIIIDLAHASEQAILDTLDMSNGPFVVSHTGLNGVCESPRNISDTTMQKIVDKGGLIGIGFWEGAICDTSLAGIAKQLRYGIDQFGLNAIALGSDWDGAVAVELTSNETPALTQELLNQGFSEDEIRAVMGGNLYRFLVQHLPQ